jgi:uncharacterized membrane protein
MDHHIFPIIGMALGVYMLSASILEKRNLMLPINLMIPIATIVLNGIVYMTYKR